MRLTSEQQRSIRQSVREADPAAAVYLFGSRVDDSRRIGLRERFCLLMRLEDRLGAQRIDLVVKPALDDPFARMASAEGVRL
jgi:predicted nucleotidyltransferase